MQCAVCSVQCAVCSVYSAIYSLQCAVCLFQRAVCSVHRDAFSLPYFPSQGQVRFCDGEIFHINSHNNHFLPFCIYNLRIILLNMLLASGMFPSSWLLFSVCWRGGILYGSRLEYKSLTKTQHLIKENCMQKAAIFLLCHSPECDGFHNPPSLPSPSMPWPVWGAPAAPPIDCLLQPPPHLCGFMAKCPIDSRICITLGAALHHYIQPLHYTTTLHHYITPLHYTTTKLLHNTTTLHHYSKLHYNNTLYHYITQL